MTRYEALGEILDELQPGADRAIEHGEDEIAEKIEEIILMIREQRDRAMSIPKFRMYK